MNIFCLKCGKDKVKYKTCWNSHHSLLFYNTEDAVARYTAADDIPIEVYDKTETATSLCPIHEKEATGFCFDCNRCFCERKHYRHNCIIFSDYHITNAKEFNNDEKYDFDVLNETKNVLDNILEQREVLTEASLQVKRKAIETVANYIFGASDIITTALIDVLKCIDEFTVKDIDSDFEKVEEDKVKVIKEIESFSKSQSLQNLIKEIQTEDQFGRYYKNYPKLLGKFKCIIGNTLISKHEHEYGKINLRGGYWTDYTENLQFYAFNARFIISDRVRIYFDYINAILLDHNIDNHEFNFNINDSIYFLSNMKVVKYDLINRMEVEIDSPKFKRLLTLYRTDVEVMGVTDENKVYYYDGEWKLYPLLITFDDNIVTYVGSEFSNNIEEGLLCSTSYIYRINHPSIPVSCNFIHFDQRSLILVKNRGFKIMKLIF